MSTWLRDFKPVHAQPRLWVETLWLIESREPLVFTRTIDLHAGLNIVWAKESALSDVSGLSSAGHGVGKTSLCLLFRYVLDDHAPAITTLRSKAASSFPKGGVAAKVHIDGATWLVFRPYGTRSQSMAAQCDALDQMLLGGVANNFGIYSAALVQFSIGRLAANSLPGTNQPLEWRHLLAWCIREQGTRFDGFYHWREGEGLGFKRSRRDPPLLVGSILGLVDLELDRLLRDIETKQKQVNQYKVRILELERELVYALTHAERQLRFRVKAEEDEPVFMTTVGESIESRVQAALQAAEQAEQRFESDMEKIEDDLALEQMHLHELTKARELAKLEVGITNALMDANRADFERLTKLYDRLKGLEGRCEHGNVEFDACEHIQKHKSSVSIIWHQDKRQVKTTAPELATRRAVWLEALNKAEISAAAQVQRISEKKAELRRLRVRLATSESERVFLKQSWDELRLQHLQIAQGGEMPELFEAQRQLQEFEVALNTLRAAVVNRSSKQSSRVDAIKVLTATVATRLLGAAGHARFIQGHKVRPFEVARGGEAYQVLEVLLGDIVCLIDSAVSEVSHHPGFLVHDCPREADMSERLYREFFLAVAEAAEQLGNGQTVPFQFIVTTTSPPPAELRNSDFIVLELAPGVNECMLFGRELMPTLREFDF